MVHALMLGRIVEELITLFVVLNPVDAIPIFLNASARLDERDRQKTVFIAVFVAMLVLLLFLYYGQYVLEAMQISIPAFQIAGAAVLFLFALQMIFAGRQVSAVPEHSGRDRDLSRGDAGDRQPRRAARGRAVDG
jgi:multiple antibiotic resistance protein